MITIQFQLPNGEWKNSCTCRNAPGVISNRLKTEAKKYGHVRALDSHGRLVDML